MDYYLALNKTQSTWKTASEDITPWLQFFLNIIKSQSTQALKIIEGDNIEQVETDLYIKEFYPFVLKRSKDFSISQLYRVLELWKNRADFGEDVKKTLQDTIALKFEKRRIISFGADGKVEKTKADNERK